MLRLRTEFRAGRHRLVALSPNGHRDMVMARGSRASLEDGESKLLRAMARRLGFKLVRHDEWKYQLHRAAKAHVALTELRAELENRPVVLPGRSP